ncbi:pilus assembly PilX family protein [Pseudoalteromonas nigrifaciens]|uniref:pilus assembly PilX family protein n=1 Tax=Pseudoalteromonas nigrifaciens TaxID=28109 RepID=UPI0035697EAC
MNKYPRYQLSTSQNGATLIVVLMFLLLIIVVGVIAVRNSMTSLRLATSDQVDTLLLNTSDTANKNIENIINDPDYNSEKANILGSLGFFGYFLNTGATSNRGDQIIFCYRPRQSYFFKMSEATVMTASGQSKLIGGADLSGGFCRPSRASDFVNARQNVMTQVSVTRPNTQSLPVTPFGNVPLEITINSDDATSSSPSFRIHSTSFLPALSNVSDAKITECLKKPSENAASFVAGVDKDDPTQSTYFGETRNECLAKIGVPAKVLVKEAKLENDVNSENCIDEGYGKGDGTISQACQDLLGLTPNGNIAQSAK